jgi:antitoxin (DNA-binding transcriptional repressor) of toxin-antitoxin stability system
MVRRHQRTWGLEAQNGRSLTTEGRISHDTRSSYSRLPLYPAIGMAFARARRPFSLLPSSLPQLRRQCQLIAYGGRWQVWAPFIIFCVVNLLHENIPQRELRNRITQVLCSVESGERMQITVDGRLVAELAAVGGRNDSSYRATRFWRCFAAGPRPEI